MKTETISYTNPDKTILEKTAAMLRHGGVVAFPSDTSYGLAADPSNPVAMKRLFLIKDRSANASVSCIFRNIDEVTRWAEIRARERQILKANLPGPFTFLLKPTASYPLPGPRVGIRIPDCLFTKALSTVSPFPYTATSANRSGEPSCYSTEEIIDQFNDREYQPDLILDAGVLPQTPASCVVDLASLMPIIVRTGPVEPRFPSGV